ncbi:ORC2-domain-containing protein [Polyplosphaeria fusca]|uniref:Origin recognition complex subunit 2 n=1 Tax=Polyplosphaeria fusca TaxID=682080 RepID=A0A9P4QMZ4_9PLEO|nr:ORC2-domain-containing protein [Polyplosphaeria fusca]
MPSAKRKRAEQLPDSTPRKTRARGPPQDEGEDQEDAAVIETPSKKTRTQQVAGDGTPRSILKKSHALNGIDGNTPKSTRKLLFATPTKSAKDETPNGTPTLVRNADRSARRKSNRKILERAITGEESDQEALDEENGLAQQILSEDEEENTQAGAEAEDDAPVPETPSKRGRGRPKGSGKPRKQRSPTPPQDLPPHEEFFWQNRAGGNKTSNNTLSSQTLLNHDEYFQTMQAYEDRHETQIEFLLDLHSRAFDQWEFELEEGFNICLYGYGSKRSITEKLAGHIYHALSSRPPYKGSRKTPKLVVINGYAAGTTLKEILTTVASTIFPTNTRLPNQPTALLAHLMNHLIENPPLNPIPIIINSIDSPYLRKSPAPATLATLAAHPFINLVCTADTPNFPLLWDVGLKAKYNFLFHDATTFAPYDFEMDVVESVNELMGRSGRRVGGRDGVSFVLRSLPENARSLFRILVLEQLSLLLMEDDGAQVGEDDLIGTPKSKKNPLRNVGSESTQGVEYRVLYHKAVEEFVCSSEVGFRTLLKEFHDHQMIESRKDTMGTERLWIPFRQEELEGLAEDLSDEML